MLHRSRASQIIVSALLKVVGDAHSSGKRSNAQSAAIAPIAAGAGYGQSDGCSYRRAERGIGEPVFVGVDPRTGRERRQRIEDDRNDSVADAARKDGRDRECECRVARWQRKIVVVGLEEMKLVRTFADVGPASRPT